MTRPDFSALVEEDACLVILKELAVQTDGSLSDSILVEVVKAFGHNRTRDWVRARMRRLAEVGGVRLTEVGTVLIATITTHGEDHVQSRLVLDGVKRPSRG
jgi:hypothetical protein